MDLPQPCIINGSHLRLLRLSQKMIMKAWGHVHSSFKSFSDWETLHQMEPWGKKKYSHYLSASNQECTKECTAICSPKIPTAMRERKKKKKNPPLNSLHPLAILPRLRCSCVYQSSPLISNWILPEQSSQSSGGEISRNKTQLKIMKVRARESVWGVGRPRRRETVH